MHVVGIRLKNFARFRGEHEIAPLQPIAYAIVARDSSDETRSNYLGKSTLPVALRYALYGELPKQYETLDAVITNGEEEMSVEVELSDGTFISRDRKRGKWAKLSCTTPDGVEFNQEAAQEVIVRYVGLDLDNYDVCADVAQKKADRFSTMTSGQITDVVNGWVGLDRLIDAEDSAAKGLAQLTRELGLVEAEVQRFEWATPEEGERRKTAQRTAALEVESSSKLALETEQQAIEHARWVDHQQRADRAHRLLESVTPLIKQLGELPTILPMTVSEEQQILTNRWSKLEAVTREVTNLRQVATGQFDGRCPVLPGFECPARSTINSSRQESLTLLNVTQNARTEAAHAHSEQQAVVSKLNGQVALQSRLMRDIDRLEAERAALKGSIEYIDEHGSPPEQAPVHHRVDTSPVELAKRAVKDWQEAVAARGDRMAEVERRRARVAALRVAVLALEQAQRRLSEGVVQRVERGANRRLERAGIDLRVEFHWGRETNRLATRCGKCGAEFPASQKVKTCQVCNAVRGPKIEPKLHLRFSARSGAVEDVTGVAITLSASRYIRERRGADWGVVVLDEVFTSLDSALRRGLTGHLNELMTDGFEQAFIVAHSKDVLDSLPGRIEIVGSGDWSTVRVVA